MKSDLSELEELIHGLLLLGEVTARSFDYLISFGEKLSINLVSFSLQQITKKSIPLSGIITDPNQEISGLDWYKDNLVLLPENLNGFVFIIPKEKIIKSIALKNPAPIFPEVNIFKTPNYSKTIKGFEGFESIAFNNDKFFVTIEAKDNDEMKSYLAWGKIDSNSLNMTIHKDSLKEIKTPIQVKNMTYESALIYKENIILLYEANGRNLQSKITQPNISLLNHSISSIKFPNIEYRITDATKVDINDKIEAEIENIGTLAFELIE